MLFCTRSRDIGKRRSTAIFQPQRYFRPTFRAEGERERASHPLRCVKMAFDAPRELCEQPGFRRQHEGAILLAESDTFIRPGVCVMGENIPTLLTRVHATQKSGVLLPRDNSGQGNFDVTSLVSRKFSIPGLECVGFCSLARNSVESHLRGCSLAFYNLPSSTEMRSVRYWIILPCS